MTSERARTDLARVGCFPHPGKGHRAPAQGKGGSPRTLGWEETPKEKREKENGRKRRKKKEERRGKGKKKHERKVKSRGYS